jgi:hypothetical protein
MSSKTLKTNKQKDLILLIKNSIDICNVSLKADVICEKCPNREDCMPISRSEIYMVRNTLQSIDLSSVAPLQSPESPVED